MSAAQQEQVSGQNAPDALHGLLGDEYCTEAALREYQRAFQRQDYVKLPHVIRPERLPALKAALQRIEGAATARNFQMEGYDTPRVLSTIGGEKLQHLSPALAALYASPEIRSLVEAVVGGRVYDCANPNEGMVVNMEFSVGATHGWHVDDVPYTLVVHVEAPPPGAGGLVEFVPQWREACTRLGAQPEVNIEPTVDQCRRLDLVRTEYHAEGDAYMLRADTSLHRVTELTQAGARRAVLVFAFEASPNVTHGAAAPNVYGEA